MGHGPGQCLKRVARRFAHLSSPGVLSTGPITALTLKGSVLLAVGLVLEPDAPHNGHLRAADTRIHQGLELVLLIREVSDRFRNSPRRKIHHQWIRFFTPTAERTGTNRQLPCPKSASISSPFGTLHPLLEHSRYTNLNASLNSLILRGLRSDQVPTYCFLVSGLPLDCISMKIGLLVDFPSVTNLRSIEEFAGAITCLTCCI